MPLGSLFYTVSISASVLLLILSLLFKVAGKLRLTLPLLYMVAAVISTFFTDWTAGLYCRLRCNKNKNGITFPNLPKKLCHA